MIDYILRFLYLILFFFLTHIFIILWGFIFYYIFKLKDFGHRLIAYGFAPMFYRPKWLMYNCPIPDCQHCRLWTCPRYKNYD